MSLYLKCQFIWVSLTDNDREKCYSLMKSRTTLYGLKKCLFTFIHKGQNDWLQKYSEEKLQRTVVSKLAILTQK